MGMKSLINAADFFCYKLFYKLTKDNRYHFKMERARDNYKFLTSPKNKNTIYVIGDSHTDLFTQNIISAKKFLGQIEKKWFLAANYSCAPKIIAYHLDAVLAYSLGKKGTSNKVTEKIEYLLKGGFIPPGSLLILSFGEIDCRVHVKRQAEINKVSQLEVILNIINNYISFAVSLKNKGFKVAIYGPPGSQSENAPLDPYFPRYGSEEERNKIVECYNQKLAEECRKNGLYFFSLFDKTVSKYKTNVKFYRDGVHLSTDCYRDLEECLEGLYEDRE